MVSYYLAPALEVLRAEINQRWPRRDKASDGWIGDTAHQATPSDHNPNHRGSVNAIDVDDDGIDFPTVFAAIKRHPSARYVIYERRLYHRLRGWRSEPYSGSNPHDHHFHLSIDQTRTAEQDRRPWGLTGSEGVAQMFCRHGDTGQNVLHLQIRLRECGFDPGPLDGSYGDSTAAALKAHEESRGVTGADGKAYSARQMFRLDVTFAERFGPKATPSTGDGVTMAQVLAELAARLKD